MLHTGILLTFSSPGLKCLLFTLCLSSIPMISSLRSYFSSAISLTMTMCPHTSIVFSLFLFLSCLLHSLVHAPLLSSYKLVFLYNNLHSQSTQYKCSLSLILGSLTSILVLVKLLLHPYPCLLSLVPLCLKGCQSLCEYCLLSHSSM